MKFNYIIIQAGGKGTRLEKYTSNKPKALVSVDNLPIIFHLFKLYPKKKFLIIADYKKDVLIRCLKTFAKVDYKVIGTSEKNTCAGIDDALKFIPNKKSFLLIWSDLLIKEKFKFKNINKSAIGLSNHFECRWSFENKKITENPSTKNGISGCFLFKEKSQISDIPRSGEFVKYLQSKEIDFDTFKLDNGDEIGTIDSLNLYKKKYNSRPFNKIEEKDNYIIKKPISKQGVKIAKLETNWYKSKFIKEFPNIPKVMKFNPLVLEKINGVQPHNLNSSIDEKKTIIKNIINSLNSLHNLKESEVDVSSILENYFYKTINRINTVKSLIPYSNKKVIKVNGIECLNVFINEKKLYDLVNKYLLETRFCFIHGDCTFSNTIINKKLEPVFIDPRGYFGETKLYGDIYYDYSKVYYSLVGNYDQFNVKNFTLKFLEDESINLEINSNGYEELESYFFSLIPNSNIKKIKLIHAIIWLSLTTYAWDDYDSICGSYYNGIYYLTKFINEVENEK